MKLGLFGCGITFMNVVRSVVSRVVVVDPKATVVTSLVMTAWKGSLLLNWEVMFTFT